MILILILNLVFLLFMKGLFETGLWSAIISTLVNEIYFLIGHEVLATTTFKSVGTIALYL